MNTTGLKIMLTLGAVLFGIGTSLSGWSRIIACLIAGAIFGWAIADVKYKYEK